MVPSATASPPGPVNWAAVRGLPWIRPLSTGGIPPRADLDGWQAEATHPTAPSTTSPVGTACSRGARRLHGAGRRVDRRAAGRRRCGIDHRWVPRGRVHGAPSLQRHLCENGGPRHGKGQHAPPPAPVRRHRPAWRGGTLLGTAFPVLPADATSNPDTVPGPEEPPSQGRPEPNRLRGHGVRRAGRRRLVGRGRTEDLTLLGAPA